LLAAAAVARGAVEKCGVVRKDRVQCIWRREGLKYPPCKDPADGCGWRMWFVCAAEPERGNHERRCSGIPRPTITSARVSITSKPGVSLALRVARRLNSNTQRPHSALGYRPPAGAAESGGISRKSSAKTKCGVRSGVNS
jgi:hypothetical protein